MVDVTNPSDLPQATQLRTVASSNEVVKPSGTVSDRPVEGESSANTASSNDQPANESYDEQDPLDRATNALEQLLSENDLPKNTKLRIEMDEEDGSFIYQSVDKETGQVVNQFPPEDIMDMLKIFRSATGIAIDDSV